MWGRIKRLKQQGVLGINQRNAEFIFEYNHRSNYPVADNKILFKEAAKTANLPIAESYGSFHSSGEVQNLEKLVFLLEDFVIKPACGAGGEGIVVIAESVEGKFRKSDGQIIDIEELRYHVLDVISGLYSLGGQPDSAIVEYRVKFDPLFRDVAIHGVPDIRIIVFQGIPIMGMLRLPTEMSRGRANLHQGAVGAGIDLATGVTLGGVWKDKPISRHPDTSAELRGLQLPYWLEILKLASACYDLSKLGYLGVDIVLDQNLGPLILEINARPGLAVQIANGAGLLKRIQTAKNAYSA